MFKRTAILFAGLLFCCAPAFADNIFGNTAPAISDTGDAASIEVGLRFKASVSGQVTGVRFYRAVENPAGYRLSLWNISGGRLAWKDLPADPNFTLGWRTVNFTTPYNIVAGTTYAVSYFSNGGHYASTPHALASPVVYNLLTAPSSAQSGSQGNGTYRYNSVSIYPNTSSNETSYGVDVEFTQSNPPVNGVCGSANGVAVSTAPTANLCSTGTASAVSGSGPWNWACNGSNGGSNASCSAPVIVASGCPITTTVQDGCAAASVGTPQLPNLFSAPFAPHATAYAVRPPWNVAGVDYHVGVPSNITLKDPTVAANRPAGLSFNATTRHATVTAANTTVQGFDFCGATGGPVALDVARNLANITITQNKFCAGNFADNFQAIVFIGEPLNPVASNSTSVTFTYNEIDGKAPTHNGSGWDFERAFESTADGHTTFQYNFIHDTDEKAVRLEGNYPVSCDCIVYSNNLTYNIGMFSGHSGDHAEELFNYGPGSYEGRVIAFNTSITQMWSVYSSDFITTLTANYNVGDTSDYMYRTPVGNFNRNQITNNVMINEGNYPINGWPSGPAAFNFAIGCHQGTCDGNVIRDNYLDWSGGYYAWYPLSGISFTNVSGNMGLMTGRACDPANWNITGGGAGSGTCNQ